MSELTPERLCKLRETAKAAKSTKCLAGSEMVRFVGEFTPPTALALLDALDAERDRLEQLTAALELLTDEDTLIEFVRTCNLYPDDPVTYYLPQYDEMRALIAKERR